MSDLDLTNKIIVLELLSRADFMLSNAQICDFFVSSGYAEYFTVQTLLNELKESDMILVDSSNNMTLYSLTDEGAATLKLFLDRITSAIKDDIEAFFTENQLAMKKHNSIKADYYPATGGGYLIHCRVTEDDMTVIDLTLHAGSEELAESICTNWRVRYDDVYASLIETLVR